MCSRSISKVGIWTLVVLAVLSTLVQSTPFQRGQISAFGSKRQTSIESIKGRRQVFTLTECLRGGADDSEDSDEEEDDDDEAQADNLSDQEDEEEEEDAEEEDSEYDDEDEYDYEEEEEEEGTAVSGEEGDYDEPYMMSPAMQLYVTFGAMMLSRKVDLFTPLVVRIIRFAFIAQLVIQQLFIIYVRIQAKKNNDRTPVVVENPLSGVLKSKLEEQGGGNDMVKNLASSFLTSASTVMEYDMKQAKSMQGGVIFNMAFMWFLHFKMEQVQPLLIQVATGLLQLFYHPLFQVYVLGRNLERPFKTAPGAAQKLMEAQNAVEKNKEAAEDEEAVVTEEATEDEEEEDDDESESEEDEDDEEGEVDEDDDEEDDAEGEADDDEEGSDVEAEN